MSNTTPALTPRHTAQCIAWAHYNGQRGTDKQIARIASQLRECDLDRMLAERNISVR